MRSKIPTFQTAQPTHFFFAALLPCKQMNLLLTPVNLATVIPFMHYGCRVVGAAPVDLSVEVLTSGLRDDPRATLRLYGSQVLYGILAWVLLAPALVGGSFVLLRPLTAFLMRQTTKGSPQAAVKEAR